MLITVCFYQLMTLSWHVDQTQFTLEKKKGIMTINIVIKNIDIK